VAPGNNIEDAKTIRDYFIDEKKRILIKGEILARQGEDSHSAFFLDEGEIIVYAETNYGETLLATHRGPLLIGEIGALAGLARTASMKAATNVTVFEIEKDRLLELSLKSPDILLSAVQQLGRQLGAVNEALALYSNGLKALEERTFDDSLLLDLDNPSPSLASFSEAFKRFANQIHVKRRQYDDMAAAALIQQSFLPNLKSLNILDKNIKVAGIIRPTREVGGDFYDLFMIDPNKVALVIGDVCGKGTPASLFTAIIVTLMRTICRNYADPATAISHINRALCVNNESMMFATAFYGTLDIKTGELQYVNCGHVSPALISNTGEVRILKPTTIPLAIDESATIATGHDFMEPGDTLILITDGVTESMNISQEEFSYNRFLNMLPKFRELNPEDILIDILHNVESFSQGVEQFDDIGCLIVQRSY